MGGTRCGTGDDVAKRECAHAVVSRRSASGLDNGWTNVFVRVVFRADGNVCDTEPVVESDGEPEFIGESVSEPEFIGESVGEPEFIGEPVSEPEFIGKPNG